MPCICTGVNESTNRIHPHDTFDIGQSSSEEWERRTLLRQFVGSFVIRPGRESSLTFLTEIRLLDHPNMAPLSCCDLTSLDETVPLKSFSLSRAGGPFEPGTSGYDDTTTFNGRGNPSLDSACYWDWPSVDDDVMIDLFSGSHIERNLKATAAAKFQKHVEEECEAETHSTEDLSNGPLGACYWDWSADNEDLMKKRSPLMNPNSKPLSESTRDYTSFEYFHWPGIAAEECEQGPDECEMARNASSGQINMRQHGLEITATTVLFRKNISERYWTWSERTSVC